MSEQTQRARELAQIAIEFEPTGLVKALAGAIVDLAAEIERIAADREPVER